jgi:CheY-like chemotaxis protein
MDEIVQPGLRNLFGELVLADIKPAASQSLPPHVQLIQMGSQPVSRTVLAANPADGLAVVLPEVGYRLEVRYQAAGQPIKITLPRTINMPGMTGLEVLPKANAARPDVPVIMITAYGDTDTRRKALEGGAEALLTKPIDFVALRSEIDNRVAGAGA